MIVKTLHLFTLKQKKAVDVFKREKARIIKTQGPEGREGREEGKAAPFPKEEGNLQLELRRESQNKM